ncbi:MAG: ABC transporter substrate-binding protein [Nitrospiraceae bacterium]
MKRRQQGILTGMPFMANLASRTFVDDLGRKIYLAKPPSRIVSLAPSITETLYAIGAGEQIVGVTEFCDYPPEAKSKPKVGYARPNLETIVSLRPDLVLAPAEFVRVDILAKLERLKLAVYVMEARSLEDIVSHTQTIGKMLARSEGATSLTAEMRGRVKEVKSRTKSLSRPRVLYVLNSDPLITVGPESFIHQLIEMAGGSNVAADAPTAYPRLSMEEVLSKDPELILFPVGVAEGIPEHEQQLWKRWTTMTAVKQGRLAQISADLLNRPGPRIVEGLERLAQIIHPKAFGDQGSR